MAKLKIDFNEFARLEKRFEQASYDSLIKAAKEALIATHKIVTDEIEAAMNNSPYNFNYTGQTRDSLRRVAELEIHGTIVKVPVGFDINNGGEASLYLMYGTQSITPDRNLYDAIFGKKSKSQVREAQWEAFHKVIEEFMS